VRYCFLLLIGCFCTGFAQGFDAVLIFKDGAEIEGYAYLDGDRIAFRLTPDDKFEFWDHEMVQAVEIKENYLSRVQRYDYVVPDADFSKPHLMTTLAAGKVTLFRWTHKLPSLITQNPDNLKNGKMGVTPPTQYDDGNRETFFLKRDTEDKAVKVPPLLFFKKRMVDFFKDCPDLQVKFRDGTYKYSNLEEAVDFYNDYCAD